MALIENDGQASSLQQVMMRFYEELLQSKDWAINKQWKEQEEQMESPLEKTSQLSQNQESLTQDSERNGHKQQKFESNGKSRFPQWQEGTIAPQAQKQAQQQTDFIRVYQNSEVIFQEKVNKGGLISDNPENEKANRLAGQLEVLQSLPLGTVVASAPNLKVEVEARKDKHSIAKQVVFATDDQGKITTNILSQSQQQFLSGAEVVKQHLDKLKTNPEAQAPAEALTKLATIIENQTTTQNQVVNKLLHQNQELIELLKQRIQQPQNPNWWQQFKHRWSQRTEQKQERQVAKTIKDIFERGSNSESGLYQGTSYSIVREATDREGESFSLRDSQGKELMQFDMAASGAIAIQANRLQSQQLKDLAQARQNLNQNRPLSGAFASFDSQMNLRQQRTEQIAAQLIKGAKGENVQRQGEHYNLNISRQGDIDIFALDGRGLIYSRSKDGMSINNQMSEKDLKFFEQSLFQKPQQEVQQKVLGGMRRGR